MLYIGLGETDEWGHGRRYDLYLDAANKADRFLAETLGRLQKDPQYKDKTALLIRPTTAAGAPGRTGPTTARRAGGGVRLDRGDGPGHAGRASGKRSR